MTQRTVARRARGAVVGFAAAIAPSFVLPFAALVEWRRRPDRSGRRWWAWSIAGIAAIAVTEVVHGQLPALAATAALTILVAAGRPFLDGGSGLLDRLWGWTLGLIATGAWAWAQVLSRGGRPTGWSWIGDPNLLAHSIVVVAAAVVTWRAPIAVRIVAMAAAAVALLATGGRTGIVAWGVLVLIAAPARWRGPALAVALIATVGLLTFTPRATGLGALWDGLRSGGTARSSNLLVGTEALDGAEWQRSGVDLGASSYDVAFPTAWRIEPSTGGAQAGIRQPVPLRSGMTLDLSVEVRADAGTAGPGLMVVRRAPGASEAEHLIDVRMSANDGLLVRGKGDLIVEAATRSRGTDGWTRLGVRFTVGGRTGFTAMIGPIVGASGLDARGFEVRALQLTESGTPLPYRNVAAAERDAWTAARTALERTTIWSVAWQGFRARPWLGHGVGAFESWFIDHAPPGSSTARPPAHAHSLILFLAFGHGVVGLVGYLLFLIGLIGPAVQARDGRALALATLVLAMNVADVTLVYSGVSIPLAARLAAARRRTSCAAPSPDQALR